MELRKDPITRSWVITGDDTADELGAPTEGQPCQFCRDANHSPHVVASIAGTDGHWQTQSVVHPAPLYHIEGEATRRGDGIYDRMRPVGAHEVLVENPHHDRQLWNSSDSEIEQFLLLAARRIQDLKLDTRLKYVSVFKNYGKSAGQEFEHPNSQLTATSFVPRRVLYELRAAREYFASKERCVFCDILAQDIRQEQRIIEMRSDFVALCPYAPRVPYETWILPRTHEAAFERFGLNRPASMRELALLIRHTLQRIRSVSEEFYLVLHTSPNSLHQSARLGYWKTLDEDYHWHIEILPIIKSKGKSYTFKEVYYSPLTSETAAKRLRAAPVDA
jgi:UDPglucose--hexose-1-phosphate uridylyltransferase